MSSSSADYHRALLDGLPLDSVECAFAYGSGAVEQRGEDMSEKMVDYLLVVNDTMRFHEVNLQNNASHYSAMRFLGVKTIHQFQRYFGARLYYNTRVRTAQNRLIKYGVIDSKDFRDDMLEWTYLYAAGRIQKPVLEVISPSESTRSAMNENYNNALQVSLLQLPETFTETELFEKVASISYTGDFRQTFAEDKNKISKLVAGAFQAFSDLYSPLVHADTRVERLSTGRFQQDVSTPAIYHRLNLLPATLLEDMLAYSRTLQAGLYWFRDPRHRDVEEIVFQMSHRHDVVDKMSASLQRIVRRSAYTQTAKNALSAGFIKSVVYASAKLMKAIKSAK